MTFSIYYRLLKKKLYEHDWWIIFRKVHVITWLSHADVNVSGNQGGIDYVYI